MLIKITRKASSGLSKRLQLSIKLCVFSILLVVMRCAAAANHSESIENPLVYTRLRIDRNYLQIYSEFTQGRVLDEIPIKFNLSKGPTRELVNKYYESKSTSADDINYDDLVLNALDKVYRNRYMMNYVYNYDDPEDRRKASDPKLVSPARCKDELNYLKRKLDELSANSSSPISPELAAMFDAYGREEPGALYGNYHWTGVWNQCSSRLIFELNRSNVSKSISFQGRYCIASIRSNRWQAKIDERAKSLVKTFFMSPNSIYDYKRFFRIQVGICLPESCDSTSIDEAEQADIIRQLTVRKLNEPFKSYKLLDLYCLPDETSELRQLDSSGKSFIIAAVIWCSLIAATTYYDIMRPKIAENDPKKDGFLEKLVSAMSLKRNYTRLTTVRPTKYWKTESSVSNGDLAKVEAARGSPDSMASLDDLSFLNFFKVICMPTILAGHIGMLSAQKIRLPLNLERAEKTLVFHYALNAIFLIDWFLVMAGLVTVYVIFVTKKKVERIPISHWLYSIFHRYWRLAPMYIIVFWFCRSIFQLTGEGPVWDYGTTNMTIRGICKQESWLWPITLSSNLHGFHEECILPSWFLSITMQYYLITPVIIVGLARWPRTTWAATILAILSSTAMRIHRYLVDPHMQWHALARPRADAYTRVNYDMFPTYLYPHYRISTYLIGLLAGHYSYMVLSGQWRSSLYFSGQQDAGGRAITRRIIWISSAISLIAMMFSTYPIKFAPVTLEPYSRVLVSVGYGMIHTVNGLFFALLLVTFMLGQFKSLRSHLSHPFFTLFSRINLSLLLIHSEIVNLFHETADRTPDWRVNGMVRDWLLLLFVCYPLATVGTLLLEFPIAYLERNFIGNWLKARSSRQDAADISVKHETINSEKNYPKNIAIIKHTKNGSSIS